MEFEAIIMFYFRFILLLLYAVHFSKGYGYDSGGADQGACGRQFRSGRMHRPPCDLGGDGYCTSAGSAYPWHAVKRFVRENQGLMRRMYGDQRHSQVLKAELDDEAYLQPLEEPQTAHTRKNYGKSDFDLNVENNELFPNKKWLNNNNNEARYLREEDISNDDVLNTKFVYSEEPTISIKVVDLKSAPHFRPATSPSLPKSTTSSSVITSEETMTTEETAITTGNNNNGYDGAIIGTTESVDVDSAATDNENGQKGVIDEKSASKMSTPSGESSNNDHQPAMLFQDMQDDEDGENDRNKDNKVQVNYQMRGVNACPVKEEVVAPFWANNTRGEVLALLNMYPFEQYVHWEKCTHEHRQMYCRDGCRCEQQYRLHRLLAYDPNNECRGIFADWFRFPSCCLCKCYSIPPAEFRVTSRSPRANSDIDNGLPDWYRRKNRAIFSDHG